MALIKANLVIDQGSTFASSISILDENDDPINMTSYSARGQIRKHYTSSNSVSFTTTLTEGLMVISLTANQTANMASGRYVYDIELIDPTDTVVRILEGQVTVTPEVTR